MATALGTRAKEEVRGGIQLLWAKRVSAIEIRCQLLWMQCDGGIRARRVGKWYRQNERTSIMMITPVGPAYQKRM